MLGKMSQYLQDKLAAAVLTGNAFTAPSSHYIGLFTALDNNTDGETRTEVSGPNGYARQALSFNAPSSGVAASSAKITFPQATGSWGTLTNWAIFDDPSAGNMLYYGDVANPLTLTAGEQFEIPSGNVTVTHSGALGLTLSTALLNLALRGQIYVPPNNLYVGLLSAYTNESTFTEVSTNTYTRQSVQFQKSSNGNYNNIADVVYNPASTSYTPAYAALFSAASGGNVLLVAPVPNSAAVDIGKYFRLLATAMTVTFD